MKKTILMTGCAAAVCLAGCRCTEPGPTKEQITEMQKTLQEINKTLIELKTASSEMIVIPQNSNSGSSSASKKQIKIKVLPKNPTDNDILNYINAIQRATIGQNTFSPNDYQVELYKKIGPGHLKLLLSHLKSPQLLQSYHLQYALPALTRKEDKKEILANLRHHPTLLRTVIQSGWIEEAKPTFFDIIQDGHSAWELQQILPYLIKTDAERKRVIDLYINARNASFLFDIIRTFPNVDLAGIAATAWKKHQMSDTWQRKKYAWNAASQGNIDALGDFITQCIGQHSKYDNSSTELVILTGKTPKEALEWYREHKSKLFFNKEKQMFEVKK